IVHAANYTLEIKWTGRGGTLPVSMIAGSSLACLLHVCSLRSFRTLHDLEFDRISFLQSTVAVANDCGVVDKDIGAVIAPDKSVSFGIIEPFDRSSHRDCPPMLPPLRFADQRLRARLHPHRPRRNCAECNRTQQLVNRRKAIVGDQGAWLLKDLNRFY